MFGYTYKLTTVNPDKNVVRLTPTASTWLKAFAPAIVIWGLFGLSFAAGKIRERQENFTDQENLNI